MHTIRLSSGSIPRLLWLLVCATSWLWLSPTYAQTSGVSPNVLSLPKGPGSLGGIGENVQANLNMGLMSYQIKLLVPEGRGSATPDPSIRYSSSGGSGIVGIGWSFSAGSRIERGTVRGLPKYDNSDIMFAGGELVKIPNSPFYRSRYEGGFMRYRWVQKNAADQRGYWIVEAPDGSKMYYGADETGKLDLDAHVYGSQGTFRWELVASVDRNGNVIRYSYFKEGTQSYPDQIRWVFDDAGNALYSLKFLYEDRPDHISDGKPGFDLKTTKRLHEVQITSAGKRFRSYKLQFEDGTGLSRLIKVTRYGRDGTSAYPIAFSMKYSDAVFSKENSRMVTMSTSLGVDFRSGNVDFLDINGDGLPDVVDTSKPKHVFHINQLTLKDGMAQDAHDFPSSLMKENPVQTSAQLKNPSVQMLDYNGDGFTDMVDAVNKKIYINRGNEKWEDSSASLQFFPVDGKDPNMRFMDYNGDKKIDVISSDGSATTFWVADGKGNWTVTPGKVNIGLGFAKDRLRLIDINGDGLQDVVHITKSSLRYRKYLGYGNWSDWIDVKVNGLDKYELSTNAQFNDVNGDGMADMVAFFGNKIVYFVNKNGEEFKDGVELQTFEGIDLPDATKSTIRLIDINGNGSRDIVWIDSSGKVVYLELFGKRPNLMTQISNGIGQRINVEYGSSVYFYLRDKACKVGTDKACSGPWQNKMPMAFPVVTKISTWASRSDKPLDQAQPTQDERPQIQSIYYHHGFYDGDEKKFRGFRHVETLYDGDPAMGARKDEIKYDVGDKDPYMHGRQLSSSISDGAGKVYQQVTFGWGDCQVEVGGGNDASKLVPPIRFLCLQFKETTLVEGRASEAKTLREEYTYDGFGNQSMVARLGDKDKSGDEQITKTTYITPKDAASLSGLWLLRFPQKESFCDSKAADRCAERMSFYDGESFKGLAAGQLRKGNRTRIQLRRTLGKDDFIEVGFKYDSRGNLVASRDGEGNLRELTWDDVYQRFIVADTRHLKGRKLETKADWDYAQSKITRSTDYNGLQTRYTYDVFGRLKEMFLPGDTSTPTRRYSYNLKAPLSSITTDIRSKKGDALDQQQVQCFDGLGRKLYEMLKVEDGKFVVGDHVEYTREGQIASRWYRYHKTSGECSFAPPSSAARIQFFYDGMRRLIRKQFPGNAELRVEYLPLQIVTHDEEDTNKDSPHFETPTIQLQDGLGRIIEERKMPAKGQEIITKFAYTNVLLGGASKIAKQTFADGSEKVHEYDLLGNVTKLIDPDRSSTTTVYNKNNYKVSVTDGRGVTVLYTYDAMDRVVTRQQKDKPETRVTYTYDVPPQGEDGLTFTKGQMTSATFQGGRYLYSYDQRGLRSSVTHELMGVRFVHKYTYNNLEQVTSVLFPNEQKLDVQYDGAGRVREIVGKLSGFGYDDRARLTSLKMGNGLGLTRSFDDRDRLTSLKIGDGKVFSIEYTRDDKGNITQMKQQHGDDAFENTYEYDGLYRLTKAVVGGGKETLTYKQDKLHNLTSKLSSLAGKSLAHIGAYQYDATKIHAVNTAGEMKLTHDKAGHVKASGKLEFRWDELGRKIETRKDGELVGRSWYGTGSRRLIKEEGGAHVFYISELFELRDGAFVSYAQLGPDRLVATWSAKGIDKFFDDVGGGKADGQINAGDAIVYAATKRGDAKADLKKRPLDIDLTKDMLNGSLQRMLLGDDTNDVYYHVDHLGSVRAVSDDKGQILRRTHYYPYGAIRAQSGAMGLFAHGYQGTELDKASALNAFLLRPYDARMGKWLSPDPVFAQIQSIYDESNSYGAVMNNPIRMRDLHGGSSKDSDGTALWAVTGALSGLMAAGAAGGAYWFYKNATTTGIQRPPVYADDRKEYIQAKAQKREAISGMKDIHARIQQEKAEGITPTKEIRQKRVQQLQQLHEQAKSADLAISSTEGYLRMAMPKEESDALFAGSKRKRGASITLKGADGHFYHRSSSGVQRRAGAARRRRSSTRLRRRRSSASRAKR